MPILSRKDLERISRRVLFRYLTLSDRKMDRIDPVDFAEKICGLHFAFADMLERISIPRSYPLNSSKPYGSGERRTAQPLPRSPRRPSSISCAAAQSPASQRKEFARH